MQAFLLKSTNNTIEEGFAKILLSLYKPEKIILCNSKVTYIWVTLKLLNMQKEIRHTWFFTHSPECVWDYLTKPELLSQWLMENDIKPIVGHKFRFKTKARIKFGFDGTVYCEILEVIPFQKLVYSWKGGTGKENVTLDSVVTWTLTSRENGTELLLEHTGFKGLKNYVAYLVMNKGWAKIGKRVMAIINKNTHDTTRP